MVFSPQRSESRWLGAATEEETVGGKGMMNDEQSSASSNLCCICGEERQSPDLVIEERPSGDSGGAEEWPYCLACWFNMSQLRKQELHLERLLEELER
jgi:hypothetical protein